MCEGEVWAGELEGEVANMANMIVVVGMRIGMGVIVAVGVGDRGGSGGGGG